MLNFAIFAVSAVLIKQAARKDSITMVREATTKFHRTQAARETGYNLIPGLDTCFQNYPRDGLGYHHINTSLLNSALDILDPEAIVYVPDQREGRICMFCTPGFGRITPLA